MVLFATAVVTALVASFLCSMSEAVILSVTHAQIEAVSSPRARRLLRGHKRDAEGSIAAILVVNTTANTLGAAVAGASCVAVFGPDSLIVFSVAFTVAVLVLGELVPKTLGVASARRLAPLVAYFVRALVVVLAPLLAAIRAVSRLFRRGKPPPITSVEEIRLLAALGRNEGAVGARVAAMIEGAASLRDLTAYDVMVPRGRVAFLSANRALSENLAVVRDTAHSRFPYTRTGDLDGADGVILAKDLLFHLRDEPDSSELDLGRLVAPALIVSEHQPLDRLLRTFQEQRRHLAFVVDEYGGVSGIVTLEDVLEEIVGEIEDESDRVNPHILRRPDGSLLCRGWAEFRKLCELLGIDEGENDFSTVGGFLAAELERVPRAGDVVSWHGYRFEVTHATPRRVERLEIRPLHPATADGQSTPASD